MSIFERIASVLGGLFTPAGVKEEAVLTNNKRAVCVGVNVYSNPMAPTLHGCCRDAQTFSQLLSERGFAVTTLLDSQATKQGTLAALQTAAAGLSDGGVLVWTNSSHGSQIDTATGTDDVIVTTDTQFISGQEIQKIFRVIESKNIRIQFVSDSCHSGSVDRDIDILNLVKNRDKTSRFIPAEVLGKCNTNVNQPENKVSSFRKSVENTDEYMDLLMAGCLDNQSSFDANIDGVCMGAMSYYCTQAIKANPNITWANLYAEIRKNLPSNQYPQTPVLSGTDEEKARVVFA